MNILTLHIKTSSLTKKCTFYMILIEIKTLLWASKIVMAPTHWTESTVPNGEVGPG